jgi:hypothetical protein
VTLLLRRDPVAAGAWQTFRDGRLMAAFGGKAQMGEQIKIVS